jgi:peptidoglycan LD-endopeptidase CwlK
MHRFSLASMQQLSSCDIRLQQIMTKALEVIDLKIIVGYRGKEEQNKAYAEGKSQVQYPYSKHNSLPSKAVDVVQYFPSGEHIHWKDRESFALMAGIIKTIAATMGYKIRWGGDWDSDNDTTDEKFRDLGHFEIVD